MKLTALMENRCPAGLKAEHGLAVDVQYNGHHYLLDTGASDAFAENADQLGIDLSTVELAFLSHGHYDHSGGYRAFFARNRQAKVYVRQGAQEEYYSGVGPLRAYIGTPKGLFEEFPDRFVFVEGDANPAEGVWLLPDRIDNGTERGRRAHMSRKTAEGYVPDDFRHEQSLVLEGERGLVVLNSCCHGGVDAIAAGVLSVFPGKHIHAVVGGFHLMGVLGPNSLGPRPESVRAMCARLRELDVDLLLTGHCTGTPGFALLKEELGERVRYFQTGDTAEL